MRKEPIMPSIFSFPAPTPPEIIAILIGLR
jgi:hypothetical protein